MPPYFNFSLQFSRRELHPGFMSGFDAHLERCGLRFKAGYWNGAGCTQEEIAAANQAKLEEDIACLCEDDHPHGHRQILYTWKDYSHVRGIWTNRYPDRDSFCFDLIIPEWEVLTWEDSWTFRPERVEELLELGKALWQLPAVQAIQTGLESCDGSTPLEKLRLGEPPRAYPFAILPPDCPCAGVCPIFWGGTAVAWSQAEKLSGGRPGTLLWRSGCVSYTLP